MYDIVIIGAGPAGLTSAIYARRALKKVLVLEALTYGGQIVNTLEIDNYPVAPHISGFDFATKIYNQAKDLGAEFIFEKAIEIKSQKEYKEVITEKSTYKTKCIIIATGSDNKKLGLTNEKELIGKGISYCATCDGNFYKGQDVAVIGGGNTAIEDALYLTDIAKKVYVIHRRDSFRADELEVKKLQEKKNIEILYNSNVTKLIAKEKIEQIEVTNNNGEVKVINVAGVFIAIGRNPANESFKDLIKTDDSGYVLAKEDCHTNISGIYVAGDSRVKELRQLVTATSDGAVAATEAVKYLNNNCK